MKPLHIVFCAKETTTPQKLGSRAICAKIYILICNYYVKPRYKSIVYYVKQLHTHTPPNTDFLSPCGFCAGNHNILWYRGTLCKHAEKYPYLPVFLIIASWRYVKCLALYCTFFTNTALNYLTLPVNVLESH